MLYDAFAGFFFCDLRPILFHAARCPRAFFIRLRIILLAPLFFEGGAFSGHGRTADDGQPEKHEENSRQHQRHTDLGVWNHQLVCAEPFDSKPDQAIPGQIPVKDNPGEFLFAAGCCQNNEKQEASNALEQKQRRDLNKRNISEGDGMFSHGFGHFAGTYAGKRQLHGKELVGIFPK